MLRKLNSLFRLFARARRNWSQTQLHKCNLSLNAIVFQYLRYRFFGSPYSLEVNHTEYGRLFFPLDKLIEGYDFIEVGTEYLKNLSDFFPNFKPSKLHRVIDIGSHVGALSFPLRATEISFTFFEPNDKNFDTLMKNVRTLNNPNCVRSAVSITNGYLEFTPGRTSTTGHLKTHDVYKITQDGNAKFSDNQSITNLVKTTSFEDIISELDPNEVVLLKMDIEGAEHEILKEQKIKISSKIDFLIVEVHPINSEDAVHIDKILRLDGYDVKKVDLGNGCYELYASRS